jgi:D-glycerate 3-kinase
VAQTIDEWCLLGVKPSRNMKFNEFDLSMSEFFCIYHYYVPMFLWCKRELKLHTLKYKKGKYVRPLWYVTNIELNNDDDAQSILFSN